MTGLDKMINQILDEANHSASAKLDAANAKAEEILTKARAEADAKTAEISEKSQADQASYQERMKSSADLKRRTAILQAKQEVIAQVMEKAYQKFCSMSQAEYFGTLKKMVKVFALPQQGLIYLTEKDLKKLPAGFEKEIQDIAAEKGGSLRIADETRELENGFVLAYGGIEENCSFRALFDAKKDELQDKVQSVLFS